jgi:8-oxo-dGTP pyrophosphatase MutT (NUDIX family)
MSNASRLTLPAIRAALRLPLPGRAAQLHMAVRPRPGDREGLPNPCPKEGAVLLLLYERGNHLVLPLTQRTETVEKHRGQISLPGGAREALDAGFAQTALRETHEELGVPEEAVELLAPLTPLYIPPSRFCVYPFVGYTAGNPALHADPREVQQILEVPVEHLLNPQTRVVERHIQDGQSYEVPVYQVANQRVWGATAMILAEFLALLDTARAATT